MTTIILKDIYLILGYYNIKHLAKQKKRSEIIHCFLLDEKL